MTLWPLLLLLTVPHVSCVCVLTLGSAFPSRNERDVKSREFEDWLSGLSGIEFVRQATATGEMPKDTVGHGMPRVWSESVLNSSIGRTNAGQWPYSVANKTKYPTVAAVFTSKSNPVEVRAPAWACESTVYYTHVVVIMACATAAAWNAGDASLWLCRIVSTHALLMRRP